MEILKKEIANEVEYILSSNTDENGVVASHKFQAVDVDSGIQIYEAVYPASKFPDSSAAEKRFDKEVAAARRFE